MIDTTTFKKEWSEEDFKTVMDGLWRWFKDTSYKDHKGNKISFPNKKSLGIILGLPYTSSGEFACMSMDCNTNLLTSEHDWYSYVALTEDNLVVLVKTDINSIRSCDVVPPRKVKYFITCKDTFLSGGGRAGNKSNKLIFTCASYQEARIVEMNARKRSDMKYVTMRRKTKDYRLTMGSDYCIGDKFVQIKTRLDYPSWYSEKSGF